MLPLLSENRRQRPGKEQPRWHCTEQTDTSDARVDWTESDLLDVARSVKLAESAALPSGKLLMALTRAMNEAAPVTDITCKNSRRPICLIWAT